MPATDCLDLDPDDIQASYDRAGCAALSDAQLFDRAAAVVSIPKLDAASSFVLHAPLELMARALLLPLVPGPTRRAARERMLWVAARYERAGEPVEPLAPAQIRAVPAGRDALVEALVAGDLERVDAVATRFLAVASRDELMALAGPTIDQLAAAGHAPIGLFLASRLATTSRYAIMLVRPTLRELARAPEWRVRWVRGAADRAGDPAAFAAALASTPRLGLPGNDFIYPLVRQVDGPVARDVIDGAIPADIARAAAAVQWVAASSMLQDDPAFAPYGWTHCLTLPQAIFEIVPWLPDRHVAAAVAATYVVAFRAAEGARALDLAWVPEPTATPLVAALDDAPAVAAGAWFHASEATRAEALPELVGRAAVHEDAHLAKYTLACLVAGERDPARRPLYLAASAYLSAWWAGRGATGFRDDL